MYKSFKIRLYPNKTQEILLEKHIGACRYIWNYMLENQKKLYENGEKTVSAFNMMALLSKIKKTEEHQWLYDVSNSSCQIVCRDLKKAYDGAFKSQRGFPKFKSKKRSKPSFPTRPCMVRFKEGRVSLEKIGKVKYKSDLDFLEKNTKKIYDPRILKCDNKWILSFCVFSDKQAKVLTDKAMGIDLGVKDLAIVAFGEDSLIFPNINKSQKIKKLNQKLKRLNKKIARKYQMNKKGNLYIKTKNIEKAEKELRRIYSKITNIRNNYLHQVSHKIVELRPYKITMETLDIQELLKNKRLSRLIKEQSFYKFIELIKYKSEEYGIEFIQAERFFPSSKTCSECGCIKPDLKLSDRTYVCKHCGLIINRDLNAAINLMRYKA